MQRPAADDTKRAPGTFVVDLHQHRAGSDFVPQYLCHKETSRSCSKASSVMPAWPRSTEMAAPGTAALILRATAKMTRMLCVETFPRTMMHAAGQSGSTFTTNCNFPLVLERSS